MFRTAARELTCHQPDGLWEGHDFSRATTIPMNSGLQPLRDQPTLYDRLCTLFLTQHDYRQHNA